VASTWGEGNRDANRVPGHIQSVSKSGMRIGMSKTGAIKEVLACNKLENRLEEKSVGKTQVQVCWLGDLPMRWHR